MTLAAALPTLVALCVALVVPSVNEAPTQRGKTSLVVTGVLMSSSEPGRPLVGETVYFSPVLEGSRGRLDWLIKDGAARESDIQNPKAKTDATGRFAIEVPAERVPADGEFTLGTLWMGQAQWFRGDDQRLLTYKVPPRSRATSWRIDVGRVR